MSPPIISILQLYEIRYRTQPIRHNCLEPPRPITQIPGSYRISDSELMGTTAFVMVLLLTLLLISHTISDVWR